MRIFAAIIGLSLSVAVVLAPTPPAMAQTSQVRKSDIVRLLGQLHEFAPVRAELSQLGFRGEKLDLAVAQFSRMLNDPLIAGNIADRILATQQAPARTAAEAGGLFWPLVDRGLGHLPLRDMRYFYLVEQTMLKALSERDCGLAVKNRLSPKRLAIASGRVAARLNTPALKQYYRIQHQAARLGATRQANRLSARDTVRSAARINAAVTKRLMLEKDGRALLRAIENLDRADNRRACAAGQLFMDTVLAMEGRDLHHALILLSAP